MKIPHIGRGLLRPRGYLPALAGLACAGALHYVGSLFFGPRFPGAIAIYVVALLWAAWCGYGPGILNCLLMVTVLPYLLWPNFRISGITLRTFIIILLLSLLVSTVAANRARAEEALRRSNIELDARIRQRTRELEAANIELGNRLAELENLYRQLSVGVAFLDTDLRFCRLNEQLAAVDGSPVAAHLGRHACDMLPAALAGPVEALCRRVIETGATVGDHSVTGAVGPEVREWSLTGSPVRAESGAMLGVQLVLQDVTERKRFNEQLQHTAKLESLGVLAGGIAHDFNNLLTGIMGNASLAREMLPHTHIARQWLDSVVTAGDRAADLTRQLLAYAGKGQFQVRPIDLGNLVTELQPLISTSVAQRAEVRLELAAGSFVAGDPGQMQQLIMNLVINGSEAIGEGNAGTVTVAVTRATLDEGFLRNAALVGGDELPAGDYVCLEVRDSGCGMSAATVERIFDPFFTTKFTGRGLGLAAVLGIVRGHHGGLSVVSHPGEGATFRVFLPFVVPEQEHREVASDPAETQTGRVVLVVDDEEIVRRTAKASLETHGYRVLLAESGREAISVIERNSEISLVVLDLTMPGMDGEQTFRELRRVGPQLKILLTSGYDETDVARRFTGQPLAGFVQKPYTAATLVRKVGSAVDPRSGASA